MGTDDNSLKLKAQRNRVAIVTGGTRGIGLAISKALARIGMKLLVVYKSNRVSAKNAELETSEICNEVISIQADLGLKSEAERVAAFAGSRWNRIDILVNNAGIFDFSFVEEMSEDFFDRIYRTNLKGILFMMQAVIPWMKKNHFGRIINASSISGRFADVGLSAYGCSKAGVDILTRIASAELAPYGITVNAYAPGIIYTDMTKEMINSRGKAQLNQIPTRRFGKPGDVTGLIKLLCSDEASYITGEVIGIDGGMLKVQNPTRAYDHVQKTNRRVVGGK